ncbi:MAG: hypothetical protein IT184_03785 [Acidobacteria bacterium]|nr:hypothetical protein [Acidobacteriota bacterium]
MARATVIGAFLEGWRRVVRAPALTASVMVLTFLTALPLAIALRASMERHLGASAEAERALSGWNETWALEFSSSTPGLGRTFTHDILGFGGTLAALSRFADAEPIEPALAGAIATYLVLWTFLSGGILDRVARARPVRPAAFFAAAGVYFLRFLRLAVPIGLAYWALFRWFRPLLFSSAYDRLTRDLANEHQAVILRGALYLTFAAALATVNVIADFAKVRMVVEDRHSAIGALSASVRFVRRRFRRVAALYLLNVLAAMVVARLWLQTAPSASAPLWLAFAGGELYLLCRVWTRLAFMASEVVFFQGEFAHATFTAAPAPIWPDSPAVEAIHNLRKRVDG